MISNIAQSGINKAILGMNSSANRVANVNTKGYDVRLEKEATDMMQFDAMNKMNASVLKAQDEMLGTIIDAFA